MYLVYNHKKKTPVEDEPGTIPYFIVPAKWIVNSINDFIEVNKHELSSSQSLLLKNYCTTPCILTFTQKLSF